MRILRFISHIMLPLLLFTASTAQAQFRSEVSASPPPSVLHPAPSLWWIGPQIGASINMHAGPFFTEFCQCSFEDGEGLGVGLGIELGHEFSPGLAIAVKLLYNDLRADYSYIIRRETLLETGEVVELDHERSNNIEIAYFMLHPALQYHLFPGFYLFAGPAIGINAIAEQTYTLRITDDRYEIAFGGGDERVIDVDSGEIEDKESLRVDVRAGLGFNIRLARSFLFAPEVSYGMPITTIASADEWKASALHIIGVFKFEL